MSNHEGGFGLGRAFAPGERTTRTGGTTQDIKIPLLQGVAIWAVWFIFLFGIYLMLKAFITTRADWSLLIGLVSIPVSGYSLYWLADHIIWPPELRLRLAAMFALLIVAGTIGALYIAYVVPQMIITLNEEAHYIALVCAVIALIQPRWSTIRFFVSEHTNALRNSDSLYAIKSLEYEHGDAMALLAAERDELAERLHSATAEIEALHRRGSDIRIVEKITPTTARIAGRDFDRDLLRKFISEGFGDRGLSRAAWVGQPAIDRHSNNIRREDWNALRSALETVGLIKDDKPTLSAKDALGHLRVDPPTPPEENDGPPA